MMLEHLKKEEILSLAKVLMFDLSDEEVTRIQEEFDVLLSQLKLLEQIDTEGVEPMIYPNEQLTHWMRPDVVDHQLSTEAALLNAPQKDYLYFRIPKVVKQDE